MDSLDVILIVTALAMCFGIVIDRINARIDKKTANYLHAIKSGKHGAAFVRNIK